MSGPTSAYLPSGRLVRLLYTQNPFYAISASLVFWGLRVSFAARASTFDSWALLAGLGSYTLLLAATAWLLIRRGQVWDDARSLLLLIVLMFVGQAVACDDALAADRRAGTLQNLIALALAVTISEMLLRSLGIRLRAPFRVPYYLTLALFFLYPVAIGPLLGQPHSPQLQWSLFGFSAAAGAVALTLLPAVRRGRLAAVDNGTPWRWPLFPWSLFVVLGVAACLRAYYLCISLHFVIGRGSIFGAYFLTPLLLAVAVLLLEAARTARSEWPRRLALLAPLGVVVLAAVGHRSERVYQEFLELFSATLGGTPVFVALLAVLAFHVYAVLRRVRGAADALSLSLALLAVVGPATMGLSSLDAPHFLPLLAVGILQGWLTLRRRESHRAFVAAVFLTGGVSLALRAAGWSDQLQLVPAHLIVAALAVIGACWNDWFARTLRHFATALILVAAGAALALPPETFGAPAAVVWLYPAVLAGAVTILALLTGRRYYYQAAAAVSAVWATGLGLRAYLELRQHLVGLDYVAAGGAAFVIAALISLIKARGLPAWPHPDRRSTDSS